MLRTAEQHSDRDGREAVKGKDLNTASERVQRGTTGWICGSRKMAVIGKVERKEESEEELLCDA